MSELGIPPLRAPWRAGDDFPLVRTGITVGSNAVIEAMAHRPLDSELFLNIPHTHTPLDRSNGVGMQGFNVLWGRTRFTDYERGLDQATKSVGPRIGVFLDKAVGEVTSTTHLPVTRREKPSMTGNLPDGGVLHHGRVTQSLRTTRSQERRGVEAGVAINARTIAATIVLSAGASILETVSPNTINFLPTTKVGNWKIPYWTDRKEVPIPEDKLTYTTEYNVASSPYMEPYLDHYDTQTSIEPFSERHTVLMEWARKFKNDPKIATPRDPAQVQAVVDRINTIDQIPGTQLTSIEVMGHADAADNTRDGIGGVTTPDHKNQEVADAREDAVIALINWQSKTPRNIERPEDYQAEDSFSPEQVSEMMALADKYGLTPQQLIEKYHRGELAEIPEIDAWGKDMFDANQNVVVVINGYEETLSVVPVYEEECHITQTGIRVPVGPITETETTERTVTTPLIPLTLVPFLFYAARRRRIAQSNRTTSEDIGPYFETVPAPVPKLKPVTKRYVRTDEIELIPSTQIEKEAATSKPVTTEKASSPEGKEKHRKWPWIIAGGVAVVGLGVLLAKCDADDETPTVPAGPEYVPPTTTPILEPCVKTITIYNQDGSVHSQKEVIVYVNSEDVQK